MPGIAMNYPVRGVPPCNLALSSRFWTPAPARRFASTNVRAASSSGPARGRPELSASSMPTMLLARDMLASAQQCEKIAERSDAAIASSLRQVARQWREMAVELELPGASRSIASFAAGPTERSIFRGSRPSAASACPIGQPCLAACAALKRLMYDFVHSVRNGSRVPA